jgi:TrmH RNA methyltransferase
MSKKINNEMRIYGENACLAVFKNRPEDIIQFFYTKNKTKDSPNIIRDITTYLAKNKKAYHMVTSDEIEKLTKATHHEDMSMLVKKKNEITLDNFIRQKNKEANPKSLILVLEDVSNPHNVGAILRTAAHFGVDALIISSKKVAETASSIRVSEGGSEFVNVFESNDIGLTLKLLVKEKYQIITTSSHAK